MLIQEVNSSYKTDMPYLSTEILMQSMSCREKSSSQEMKHNKP